MRPSRGSLSAASALWLSLYGLSPAIGQAISPAGTALLLDVSINGSDTEKVAEFLEKGHLLYARARELRAVGIEPSTSIDDDALVNIASLSGVAIALNEQAQTLGLTVPTKLLTTHRLDAHGSDRTSPNRSPLGALLNYDLTTTVHNREIDIYGIGSARLFGPFGTLQNDFSISRMGEGTRAIRLATTYSYSDPEHLRTYAAGDVVTGSLPYSRSFRLGGVQLSTNFALRPDLITYPLPTISGGAAVPSTVDVLVNGIQQLSTPVSAGPFYVPQLPVVSGAGQISVSVRDASGRQSVQTSSFYTSSALLRPGLSSYSVEIGAIRRNFGVSSNDYGPVAASATIRQGLTDGLTLDGHLEAAGGLGLVNSGATVKLGQFAIMSGAVGLSQSKAGSGLQGYFSADRSAGSFHIGVSALGSSARFRDIGSLVGDPSASHIVQVNAGYLMGPQGSIGIAFTDVAQRAVVGTGTETIVQSPSYISPRPAIRTSLLSATYSRDVLGKVYVYITGYDDARAHRGAIMGGLSFRFGGHGSVNTTYESGGHDATIEASKPALNPGDIGWRVYGAAGSNSRGFGEVQYRGQQGEVGLGLDTYGGTTYGQISARGSIVAIGGGIYTANPVTDGFALVDTQGIGHVGVTLNNRPVGRTSRLGKLFVPGLVAYQNNSVEIDPSDLPLDTHWDRVDTAVTPAERAGTIARFGLTRLHPLLLTLRDDAGVLLPLGSRVVAFPSGTVAIIGFDGQVYFGDVGNMTRATVKTPDGATCTVDIRAEIGVDGLSGHPARCSRERSGATVIARQEPTQ